MISHVPAHYIPFLTNLVGFISQIINISLHDPDQEVSKAWVSERFKITLYMAFTGSKSQLNWRDFEALSPKWSDFLIVHIKTFKPPSHSLPLQKLIISKYCWTMIQSSPTPNLFHDILHPFSYHIISLRGTCALTSYTVPWPYTSGQLISKRIWKRLNNISASCNVCFES